jgi:hypothetical protein
MRRAVGVSGLIVAMTGCVRVHQGELVSSVQLLASTVPVVPGGYEVGPWVAAEGCDYLDTDFFVGDLVYKAQGDYDALVNVTVEQVQQVRYTSRYDGVVTDVSPSNRYCYRVHGQAARLVEPPRKLPGAD